MDTEALRAELRRIPELEAFADSPAWHGTVRVEVLEGDQTVVRVRLRGARVEVRFGEDGEVEGYTTSSRIAPSVLWASYLLA